MAVHHFLMHIIIIIFISLRQDFSFSSFHASTYSYGAALSASPYSFILQLMDSKIYEYELDTATQCFRTYATSMI